MYIDSLDALFMIRNAQSRSISPENPTGNAGMGGMEASKLGSGRKGRPKISLEQGEVVTLADIQGPGVIRHIWCTTMESSGGGDSVLRDLILRIYWDDEASASVEVPIGDFFCCGFGTFCRVDSLMVSVAPMGGMNCYWPMPFKKRARITLENDHVDKIERFYYSIDHTLEESLPPQTANFHAQWRRSPVCPPGTDHVILDSVVGRGHFVGTYLAWASLGRYWWGEGEVKVFLDDDDQYPTICTTGTEDYFGGAWCYWEPDSQGSPSERHIGTYSTAFLGYPYHSTSTSHPIRNYSRETVPSHGLYRWHILDPIHFRRHVRITVQQIGYNDRQLFERSDDISSVAYWYQEEPHVPFPLFPARDARKAR
ncbi:MAG: DUF2961 domain-containing protein [Sphaerochaetaceae bacterium]|jgi:hypothetical protein|nr:DUF2961 domain-containing protein [Sphaerochaetaceae bacterium]